MGDCYLILLLLNRNYRDWAGIFLYFFLPFSLYIKKEHSFILSVTNCLKLSPSYLEGKNSVIMSFDMFLPYIRINQVSVHVL